MSSTSSPKIGPALTCTRERLWEVCWEALFWELYLILCSRQYSFQICNTDFGRIEVRGEAIGKARAVLFESGRIQVVCDVQLGLALSTRAHEESGIIWTNDPRAVSMEIQSKQEKGDFAQLRIPDMMEVEKAGVDERILYSWIQNGNMENTEIMATSCSLFLRILRGFESYCDW